MAPPADSLTSRPWRVQPDTHAECSGQEVRGLCHPQSLRRQRHECSIWLRMITESIARHMPKKQNDQSP